MARKYRKYASRAYRGASRSYGKKVGLSLSPAFMAGMVVGFTDLDAKIPGQLVLGAATVPIRGAGLVKGAAQGVIFGNLVQQVMGRDVSMSGFKGV